MATAAQIAANLSNAALSTGPRTDPGKSRASRNAVSHGLFTAPDHLPAPLREALDQRCRDLTAYFQPTGRDDQEMVSALALAEFRADRATALEFTYLQDQVTAWCEKNNHPLPQTQSEWFSLEAKVFRDDVDSGRKLLDRFARLQQRFLRLADKLRTLLFNLLKIRRFGQSSLPPQPVSKTKPISSILAAPEPAQTPRNAPCPCGSGEKFKRCCGQNAPPVLG